MLSPRKRAQRRVRVLISSLIAAAALVAGLVAPVASAPAQAADLSQFQAGNIISDAVFFNANAMTQPQIESFLQSKETNCAPQATCVKDYYTVTTSVPADAVCGNYDGGWNEMAAWIIYKVAQACGINPQVLMVTMQKEQGLITSVWPGSYSYQYAMGADCPDTTGCNGISAGFFAQVYKGAWQLKRYGNPPGTSNYFTWYAPGHTWNILYNPNKACGTKSVYIQNQATADLYYYTPYTPNAAALAAGYGTGDSCSSYGNRNFYSYFTDWFGSTQTPPNPCSLPQASQVASATGEYTVNVTSLNGRQAPTTTCSTGIVSLSQGTIVTRVATYGTWWQVRLNGQLMWVDSQYLVATPAVTYTTGRISGADRYATAVAIAQRTNPSGAQTVFLASGDDFPDALSGTALAALRSAPLLLTEGQTLPAVTAAELKTLHPAKVVVLGGETAISPAVLSAVSTAVGPTAVVSRLSGADRYATSLAVLQSGWTTAATVYLATGNGFTDALSASAIAASQGAPVVLVDGTQQTVSAAVVSAIQKLGTKTVVIAGGTAAVSSGISSQLTGLGLTVDRKAGADRYQTSVLLAGSYASATQVYLASGENFPDALAGSVMAGREKAPLVTSPSACMADVAKDYLISRHATVATLLGGPAALSDAVLASTRC